jgi:uncharacterized RDD family membrane protein YckC
LKVNGLRHPHVLFIAFGMHDAELRRVEITPAVQSIRRYGVPPLIAAVREIETILSQSLLGCVFNAHERALGELLFKALVSEATWVTSSPKKGRSGDSRDASLGVPR